MSATVALERPASDPKVTLTNRQPLRGFQAKPEMIRHEAPAAEAHDASAAQADQGVRCESF